LAYDGRKKEIVGSRSISSSPNERKLLDGDDTLQINNNKM
jgi:hypothetical protein